MIWWIILSIFLILIAIIVILSRITIKIKFGQDSDIQKIEANIFLLDTIKIYQKKVITNKQNIKTVKQKNSILINQAERVIEIMTNSVEIIKMYNQKLQLINKKVKKGFKINQLKLWIDIGTGDAASTGLLSGVVWAILGNIRAYGQNIDILNYMNFKVYPQFKKKTLKVNLNCIFTVKTVYIIYILKLIKDLFKTEKQSIKYSKENIFKEKYSETG